MNLMFYKEHSRSPWKGQIHQTQRTHMIQIMNEQMNLQICKICEENIRYGRSKQVRKK